jgi:hypothetical protein
LDLQLVIGQSVSAPLVCRQLCQQTSITPGATHLFRTGECRLALATSLLLAHLLGLLEPSPVERCKSTLVKDLLITPQSVSLGVQAGAIRTGLVKHLLGTEIVRTNRPALGRGVGVVFGLVLADIREAFLGYTDTFAPDRGSALLWGKTTPARVGCETVDILTGLERLASD